MNLVLQLFIREQDIFFQLHELLRHSLNANLQVVQQQKLSFLQLLEILLL